MRQLNVMYRLRTPTHPHTHTGDIGDPIRRQHTHLVHVRPVHATDPCTNTKKMPLCSSITTRHGVAVDGWDLRRVFFLWLLVVLSRVFTSRRALQIEGTPPDGDWRLC